MYFNAKKHDLNQLIDWLNLLKDYYNTCQARFMEKKNPPKNIGIALKYNLAPGS